MSQWNLHDIENPTFSIFWEGYLESIFIYCVMDHVIDSTLSEGLCLRGGITILIVISIGLEHAWLVARTIILSSYFSILWSHLGTFSKHG